MNNSENSIIIGSTKFWVGAKGILYCKFSNDNPNYKLDIERAKLYVQAIVRLCNGKSMPFLIDLRGTRGTFSPEAITVLAESSYLKVLRISEAFVYNSIGMKLLIISYKRIYNQVTPYFMFSDVAIAKQYCIETKNMFYGSN
ncbi:DUF7793 family protein [Psychroserpens ponticola]|uniref:DUF7793 domain-containing protein n=1 Tax=Psychroserpens ponticola TaxID=2932268 RepID=A0ABY7S3E2_9FLAO|nr:hypothetical protein [Psychroserpens ponticola]WCO03411.1 hypothetical protein MUN68_007865 [Psychroserpens ponticola]